MAQERKDPLTRPLNRLMNEVLKEVPRFDLIKSATAEYDTEYTTKPPQFFHTGWGWQLGHLTKTTLNYAGGDYGNEESWEEWQIKEDNATAGIACTMLEDQTEEEARRAYWEPNALAAWERWSRELMEQTTHEDDRRTLAWLVPELLTLGAQASIHRDPEICRAHFSEHLRAQPEHIQRGTGKVLHRATFDSFMNSMSKVKKDIWKEFAQTPVVRETWLARSTPAAPPQRPRIKP